MGGFNEERNIFICLFGYSSLGFFIHITCFREYSDFMLNTQNSSRILKKLKNYTPEKFSMTGTSESKKSRFCELFLC